MSDIKPISDEQLELCDAACEPMEPDARAPIWVKEWKSLSERVRSAESVAAALIDRLCELTLARFEDSKRLRLADALAAELVKLDDGTDFLEGTTSRPALYLYLNQKEPKP